MASQLLKLGGGNPNTKHDAFFERKLEGTTDVILWEGKKDVISKLSLLSCDDHGGPSNEMAAEMVYWRQQQNLRLDTKYNSPFRNFVLKKMTNGRKVVCGRVIRVGESSFRLLTHHLHQHHL
jgi:hypothetical protein